MSTLPVDAEKRAEILARYPIRYTGRCCRLWPLDGTEPAGVCGLCGEVPVYVRDGWPSENRRAER